MSTAAYKSLAARMGMNERDQNAALSEYLSNGGQNLDPSVTAWCAGAVNAALAESGIEGTGSLAARSFMDWGAPVDDPQQGDIAVFSRGAPGSGQGHVGFFDGYNPDGTIRVLGGNQGDAVSIANYSPDALLGFRREADGQNALSAYADPYATPNALAALSEAYDQRRPMPQFATLDPNAFMVMRG